MLQADKQNPQNQQFVRGQNQPVGLPKTPQQQSSSLLVQATAGGSKEAMSPVLISPSQGMRLDMPGTSQAAGIRPQKNELLNIIQTAKSANATQEQIVDQIMQYMKNNQGPEQQKQLLDQLKANPQLMAAFIRHRQQNVSVRPQVL
jgi:hypothetical protein